jgi:hypothetical protein
MLVEMNVWQAARLDRAARWGRAFESTYPDDSASKLAYLRALIELGAWTEANELLGQTRELGDAGDDYMGWVYTHKGQWLAFAEGDTGKAVELAERHIRENLVPTPDWPDLSGRPPSLLRTFELLALVELGRGQAQSALDRYSTARLDPEKLSLEYFRGPAFPPAVVYATLQRYTGHAAEADRRLRKILPRIAEEPIRGGRGKGFTEFTIHAFLGETDAAIRALQTAVDEAWLPGWWSLKFGAFDANYAAVLEDPRFEPLYLRIVSRVAEMRESFRANPDLPEALLLEAGLAAP